MADKLFTTYWTELAAGALADADAVAIEDTAGRYTATDVEGALAEVKVIADSATQPGDLATVATTGAYSDLSGTPTLGNAAALTVDADLATFAVPASTTISAFGATLVDDADAATARSTLGVDAAGTDNSTDVTLAGTPDYITITGQEITRGLIDLTTDVTGDLPVAEGGTGASTVQAAIANLRVTPATVTGTTDTLAAGDDATTILYTAAGAVTVTLANIATGFECVLVSLGAGGLSVAAGGMSFANSFTPKLTVAQGEALFVKQTAASTFIVLGGTAT